MKIKFVKFYQGVMINNTSSQTSSKVIEERTTQDKNLVSITKTENSVMIVTEEQDGRKSYTEVPYNNVAYINYEPQNLEDSEQKPKATAKKPAAVAAKASSEQS